MRIILEIPDAFKEKYSEHDLKMYAAVNFYRENIMSTGVLAKAVGISRMQFIDEMGKYGCGILDMNEEELAMELKNARKYL